MEIKGTITRVMPIVEGNGKKGKWQKQEFLLETDGQYKKNVSMSIWGQDKIDKYDIEVGLKVTAFIEIESREYQNRFYTEVRAYKLEWDSQQKRKWQPGSQPAFSNSQEDTSLRSHYEGQNNNSSDDSLPF